MNPYHQEQIEAYAMVRRYMNNNPSAHQKLSALIAEYLEFRAKVEGFLSTHLSATCTQTCYQNRLSACCSREGIVTFFGDVVVNVLVAAPLEIENLISTLHEPNTGFKCIYLTDTGCRWKIKPIVCEMFLCDRAKEPIFSKNSMLKQEWELIEAERKLYTWPDRPVLFDRLEAYFIDNGFQSPLMYLHNSPGLLRVKQRAGLTR